MHDLLSSIFKEYDVRGRYPGELNEDVAERIGVAFARYLAENNDPGAMVAGYDARTSSDALFRAFVRGARSQGRDVVDIGLATSPLFYFSVVKADAAGGAMITASHNPAEWNGVKLVRRGSIPVYKNDGLPRVEELARMDFPRADHEGTISRASFADQYIDFLVARAEIKKPFRVVADASNGSSGFLLEQLCEKLNLAGEKLFFEPDGRFPNHSPNPLAADSARHAGEAIVRVGADMGCIFDADADRAVFLDEKGRRILGPTLYAFLMDKMLSRGDVAIATVFSSRIFRDVAERRGATLTIAPVAREH